MTTDETTPPTIMPMWYYIDNRGRQTGPCDTETMSEKLHEGHISSASMVRIGPSPWTTMGKATKTDVWSAIETYGEECPEPGAVANPPKGKLFWSYIDEAGHEQGPFDTDTMIVWQRRGYFTNQTQVRLWPHGWLALDFMLHMLPRVDHEQHKLRQREKSSSYGSLLEWERV